MNDIVRPTIRIDREFNDHLRKALDNKGLTFQELSVKLLEEWLEENGGN